jgi:hypothetical protein
LREYTTPVCLIITWRKNKGLRIREFRNLKTKSFKLQDLSAISSQVEALTEEKINEYLEISQTVVDP